MEYIAIFFAWLQKLFATSALNAIIILLLAALFAGITDEWLDEEFFNMDKMLATYGISDTEYWLFLIAIYAAFFAAVKVVENLIVIVFLSNSEKE